MICASNYVSLLGKLQKASPNFQPITQTPPKCSKLSLTPHELPFAFTLDPLMPKTAHNGVVLMPKTVLFWGSKRWVLTWGVLSESKYKFKGGKWEFWKFIGSMCNWLKVRKGFLKFSLVYFKNKGMVIYPMLELISVWWVLSSCPGLIGSLLYIIGRFKLCSCHSSSRMII